MLVSSGHEAAAVAMGDHGLRRFDTTLVPGRKLKHRKKQATLLAKLGRAEQLLRQQVTKLRLAGDGNGHPKGIAKAREEQIKRQKVVPACSYQFPAVKGLRHIDSTPRRPRDLKKWQRDRADVP